MTAETPKGKKNALLYNIVFIVFGLAIVLFLWLAPDETTPRLPHDENHEEFHRIESKKEAEKFCTECHEKDGLAPLPDGHPPKYRCLFCHKRDQ